MKKMFNITDIPEAFGEIFNVSAEIGGVLISTIVIVAVIMAVSLASNSLIAVGISGISLVAFFTFMGWFPIWLTILIALFIAVMFGRDAVGLGGFGGGGGGGDSEDSGD